MYKYSIENYLQAAYELFMIYVFCDEYKIFLDSNVLLRYSAIGFNQDRYNKHSEKEIRKFFSVGHSLTQPIIEILKSSDALVLFTQAQIPKDLFKEGEIISTSDIPKMVTPDFLWSVSMALTIASLFPILDQRSWEYKTVDIYYDPKSLTAIHRTRLYEVLQERLKLHEINFRKKLRLNKKFNLRRIEQVQKPKNILQSDKFQLGVWLADRCVRKYDDFASIDTGKVIEYSDITGHCLSMLNKHG